MWYNGVSGKYSMCKLFLLRHRSIVIFHTELPHFTRQKINLVIGHKSRTEENITGVISCLVCFICPDPCVYWNRTIFPITELTEIGRSCNGLRKDIFCFSLCIDFFSTKCHFFSVKIDFQPIFQCDFGKVLILLLVAIIGLKMQRDFWNFINSS